MRRRAYQYKLRIQARQWQDRIDQLTEQVRQAGSGSRREFEHRIEDLQAKKQAANRKLKELEQAGRGFRARSSERAGAVRHRVHRAVRRLVSGFR